MFTVGKNGDCKIPLCIYKNRENYNCSEKRYHILFIENGSGSIIICGRKELFIAPFVFCFNEDEVPEISMNSSDFKSRSLYLSPEFVNNRFSFDNLRNNSDEFTITDIRDRNWFKVFFERNDDFYGRINLSLPTAKRMAKIFDLLSIQLETQPDYYWICRSRSFLIEILFLIEQCRFMKDKSGNIFTSEYSDEVGKIILYLYNNYGRKITVSEIVKEFNIDRTTLNNKFKKEVGDSVINSLIKLRISLSSVMLKDTMIPVSEIMYRVGFTDLSHFNRTFKKHTGFNPSDYRTKYNVLINQ